MLYIIYVPSLYTKWHISLKIPPIFEGIFQKIDFFKHLHFTQKITAENITFSADFLVKYLVLLLELFWLTSNEVGDPYLYPTKKLFCGDPVTLGMTLTLAIPTSRKAQQVVLWLDFIRHFFLVISSEVEKYQMLLIQK